MTRIVPFVCLVTSAMPLHAGESARPPAPSGTVPTLTEVRPVVLCIGCDEPFDVTTHAALLKDLVSNPYVVELRKALYQQDVAHQFESKAHFDNCDFDSAVDYIDTLLNEAGTHADAAATAKAAGKTKDAEEAAARAFRALGQGVHGVQDFYAHSNYVEMKSASVTKVTDLEVVAVWEPSGKEKLRALLGEGLISGHVFWGFPQRCPKGTASHAELAKDGAETESGRKRLLHLQNISQYKVAVFLAREASLRFFADAFKRWPILREMSGEHVAIDILVDRRGL